MIGHRRWRREMVVGHIISKQGRVPLHSSFYTARYPDVHAAGCRLFGSWKATIEACGIDYDEVRRYRRWTKAKVLNEIKVLKEAGQPINSQHVQDHHKPLYHASLKRFGSWNKTLKAAGIDHRRVMLRRGLSKTEIREAVIALRKECADLAYPGMRRRNSRLLAAAMRRLGGGSWAEARRRCGVHRNYRLRPDLRPDPGLSSPQRGHPSKSGSRGRASSRAGEVNT